MKQRFAAPLLSVALLSIASPLHAADDLGEKQKKYGVKTLSEQEINNYLEGRGIGMAKAAEIYQYFGPRKVLNMATQIGLSPEQLAETTRLHDLMKSEAIRLGEEVIQKQAELESLFQSKQATDENTRRVVSELAKLQGDFRFVHLKAHIGMRQLLSQEQAVRFAQMQGN